MTCDTPNTVGVLVADLLFVVIVTLTGKRFPRTPVNARQTDFIVFTTFSVDDGESQLRTQSLSQHVGHQTVFAVVKFRLAARVVCT